tara:strand:+ start:156 stop:317 length:162 start_codon:yes stop_codon:yes gene_type:complete
LEILWLISVLVALKQHKNYVLLSVQLNPLESVNKFVMQAASQWVSAQFRPVQI